MTPKHQNRRLILLAIGALIVVTGMYLLLQALGESKQLFKNPSDVVAANFLQGQNQIKVGGLVVEGSVDKRAGLVTIFPIINFAHADPNIPPLKITYHEALPDLFAEGKGVVIIGKLGPDGVFVADNVLAKHDENYKPKMPKS